MQYIPEILKIIEGGMRNNTAQVASYAQLLADKLESAGETRPAGNIRKKLKSNGVTQSGLGLASLQIDGRASVPLDKDSRLSLGDESWPDVRDENIYLPRDVSKAVEEFISFINNLELLQNEGVGITPSMLIYGPPGCGKTYLASHISSKLGLPLITARCDTLISSFLGSTAKNLRNLFDYAGSRPCVLFLDEFDALAKARDDQHELGELKRVVVSLLQNIDALPEGTILLAATNHESLLDPAVWRRFAYRLQIPLPSYEIRGQLIERFLGKFCPSNTKVLVDATEGLSGAVIEQACKSEIRSAIINGDKEINSDNLIIKLVQDKYHNILRSNLTSEEKAIALRKTDRKIFTINRLAALLGMSAGKISQITSKE